MRRASARAVIVLAVLAAVVSQTHECLGDDGAAGEDQAMVEARKQFHAGVSFLDDPDGARYEEAYHAFHKAYALSSSPKVLGNIGFCSLKLERDGEAIDAYTAYLKEERDIDPRERAQIERDIATLTATTATFKVVVRAPPAESLVVVDTRIQTRGSPVVNSYPFRGTTTTIRLRPGRHHIKVKANDRESRAYEVAIEPAAQSAHEFTFAPPPAAQQADLRRTSPSYAGPVIVGALGLATVGAGVVSGLMARETTGTIESRCPNGLCPPGYDLSGDRTEAKTYGMIADGAFIGGGVLLGGALLWALLTPSSATPKRTGALSVQPSMTPGRSQGIQAYGVRVGGTF